MVEAIFLAQLSTLSSMLATVATVASSAKCWANCLASNQDCRMRALTSNKPSKVTKASTEVEAEVEAQPALAAWGVLLQCRPSRFVHRIPSCIPLLIHACSCSTKVARAAVVRINSSVWQWVRYVCVPSKCSFIHLC